MSTHDQAQQALDALRDGPDGRLALHARELPTGAHLAVDPARVCGTASCIKLFILAEMARRIDEGSLDPAAEVEMTADRQVGGSGVLKHLSSPLGLRVRDIAMLMMIQSDNTATNIALDLVGLENVNALADGLGCSATRLRNRVDFDAIGTDIRNLAVGSPQDFGTLLERIATPGAMSATAQAFMLDVLGRQHYLDLLPRYLDFNPYAADLGAAQDLWIGHKTGFFPGFRGDVAVWKTQDRTVVIAAFLEDIEDKSFAPDNPGALKLGKVGRIVAEALLGQT